MEYRKNAWKAPALLAAWEVARVRTDPRHAVEYGDSEVTVAKRKTTCRACGQPIQKGERRITFYWDFNGCGSWTAQEVHIHEADCSHALAPGDVPKIGNNVALFNSVPTESV